MMSRSLSASVLLLVLLNLAFHCECRGPLRAQFPKTTFPPIKNGVDPGDPLFLTPYLNKGLIDEAQSLSMVSLNGYDKPSYAGFITVDPKYNSNTYFWFFPAQENAATAPVLMWLQGGPGGSSLFGLFSEHGPILVDDFMQLKARDVTWNSKFSMLYVDNPVGTGFSFTQADAGYSTTEDDVATNLYNFLVQFFKIYYQYAANDFYVTGESYAGKYVPAITYKIHTMNQAGQFFINLKGMAIGNGLCDPVNMFDYGSLLFQFGMIDEIQLAYFKNRTQTGVDFIKQQRYLDAFYIFDQLLNGDTIKVPSYFTNATGSTNYYNMLLTVLPASLDNYNNYLAFPQVRRAIHVGNLTYNDGSAVEQHLLNDIMQSVEPWIAQILNNGYKSLFYNGQLDIIVAAPLSESFLWNMDWNMAAQYRAANRTYWKISATDQEVAGYVRNVGNMFQVILRGGGHMVPFDQPERTLDMLTRFVNNVPF